MNRLKMEKWIKYIKKPVHVKMCSTVLILMKMRHEEAIDGVDNEQGTLV